MKISQHFFHLFIIICASAAISNAHQLYAMEAMQWSLFKTRSEVQQDLIDRLNANGESIKNCKVPSVETFLSQLIKESIPMYLLLSAIEPDSPFYLPHDIIAPIILRVQTIRCNELCIYHRKKINAQLASIRAEQDDIRTAIENLQNPCTIQ